MTERKHRPRAGIYCRISDDREGSGLGVKRQQSDCEALCRRRGFRVAEVFVDNDISAYSGKVRPQWRELIDAVKAGDVDVIVTWHQDRLTRSPRELEDLVDVIESTGVGIATVTAGDFDLSTPTGRMIARIVGATARGESEHKSERIRRKARELAEAGKIGGGGTRPFGYEEDRRTIREPEAELIREVTHRVLAGEPLRSVVRDWHARGVRTPTGRAWAQTPLRRLLTRARISGRREHQGVIVGDAEWPAIIKPEESDALRAVLGAPRARRAPRRYLLTGGTARCGVCDAPLVARPRGDGRRSYVCATLPHGGGGCGKIRILGDPLEELISEAVLQRLETPSMTRALAEADSRDSVDPSDELARVEEQVAELAEMWAGGEITKLEWNAARRGLDGRIEELRREVANDVRGRRSRRIVNVENLRERWPNLGLDAQREIIELVLERVVVGPGRRGFNRFDPTRIDVAWRG